MDYQSILDGINQRIDCTQLSGEVASYIPELSKISPNKFGIYLCSVTNESFYSGNSEERFSIQSISKVLSLSLALIHEGEKVWERVDVEPSGNPFNSLIQLEYENGVPRNPLINPGALVICDILISCLKDPKKEYIQFIRKIGCNDGIDFDDKVAQSEKSKGHHNRAMIHLMKAYGNIKNNVEEVLDFYFHTCSVSMSCKELAQTFFMYANNGYSINNNKQILSVKRVKRINALMQTCGFYDEAGEFAFRVGLPGKSGVGGGITAIHPNIYSVAVWSPKLNKKGNSTAGMLALEMLTEMTGSSIF